MKKIKILFGLLIFSSTTAFAQYTRPSVLQVVAPQNQLIQIAIDNANDYNEWASNQVFSNIYPGRYFIKIIKLNTAGENKAIYASYIQIPEGMRCRMLMDSVGKCDIQYFPLKHSTVFQMPYPVDPRNNYPSPYPREPNRRIMSDDEFQALLQSLRKEAFEGDKLRMLKQVAASQFFEINQTIQLVKQFPFEKLACAKLMYNATITTDKGLYYKVANELSFNSDKDALYKYIEQQQAAKNENNNYPSPYPNYPRGENRNVLSDVECQTLLTNLKNLSFDQDKLKLINSIIMSHTFQSAQIAQIVRQFRVKQLECAKLMYDATIDQSLYYQVADGFYYLTDKTSLYDFIKQKQSAINEGRGW